MTVATLKLLVNIRSWRLEAMPDNRHIAAPLAVLHVRSIGYRTRPPAIATNYSNQVNGGLRLLLAPPSWPVSLSCRGRPRWRRSLDLPRVLTRGHGLCPESTISGGDNRLFLLQFQFFGHTTFLLAARSTRRFAGNAPVTRFHFVVANRTAIDSRGRRGLLGIDALSRGGVESRRVISLPILGEHAPSGTSD
jgi:hypothetical protein